MSQGVRMVHHGGLAVHDMKREGQSSRLVRLEYPQPLKFLEKPFTKKSHWTKKIPSGDGSLVHRPNNAAKMSRVAVRIGSSKAGDSSPSWPLSLFGYDFLVQHTLAVASYCCLDGTLCDSRLLSLALLLEIIYGWELFHHNSTHSTAAKSNSYSIHQSTYFCPAAISLAPVA